MYQVNSNPHDSSAEETGPVADENARRSRSSSILALAFSVLCLQLWLVSADTAVIMPAAIAIAFICVRSLATAFVSSCADWLVSTDERIPEADPA